MSVCNVAIKWTIVILVNLRYSLHLFYYFCYLLSHSLLTVRVYFNDTNIVTGLGISSVVNKCY